MNGTLDRRSLLLASGGVAAAGGSLAHAAPGGGEPSSPNGRNFAGARLSSKYRFDDADMDLFFLIALGWAPAGGLSIGEAFDIASTIRDGDAASWVTAFNASGDRQTRQADEWEAAGWKRQSAQARLKAFASYRSGWQFAPVGPIFDGLYAKHQAAFRAAIPALGLQSTFFDVPYKGKTLPGLYLQNANPRAPVVLLLGGADTCFEEIYFTAGRNVFESGYSVAMADLPGQGITMKDGLYWEGEPEKPISAIVDHLVARHGAKPGRMAMLGYSLGGYWATRAAYHEKRFATCMASTPLPRPGELLAALPPAARRSSATQRNLETMIWKAGVSNEGELQGKLNSFVADPTQVTMPFLSIVGSGEGGVFKRQSQEWHDKIRSARKRLVVLDPSTGGDSHCQAANRLRLAQEMCGWMDTVFRS